MLNLNKHVKIITLTLLSITISANATKLYINNKQVKYEEESKKITNNSLVNNNIVNTTAVLMKSDGKEIGFLQNEKEVKEVLDFIRDYYVIQNNIKVLKGYKIQNNITYLVTKTDSSKVMNSKTMAEYIIKNKDINLITIQLNGISDEQKSISPGVVIKWSEELLKGESRIKSEGKVGTKLITKETVFENDKVINERIINQKVVKSSVDKIIIKGSKNPTVVASTDLVFPSRGSISSPFGERWGKMHKGIDIAATIGTPIYVVDNGKVKFSGIQNGYGNVIKVSHDNGMETIYAHCSVLNVKEGQKVKKGQKIAEVGNTGRSTGPHLHFEVIVNGKAENPIKYLNR